MGYLKNKNTGAVTDFLDSDSQEYQELAAVRSSGATVWEETSEANYETATSKVVVLIDPGAAVGADATESNDDDPQYAGSITAAEFVPNADITGANTNSRTLTVTQEDLSGTSSPARTNTTLATLALTAGVNASRGVSKAMTINNAGFVAGRALKVVSTHVGTGIADPGGLVVLTYTRA